MCGVCGGRRGSFGDGWYGCGGGIWIAKKGRGVIKTIRMAQQRETFLFAPFLFVQGTRECSSRAVCQCNLSITAPLRSPQFLHRLFLVKRLALPRQFSEAGQSTACLLKAVYRRGGCSLWAVPLQLKFWRDRGRFVGASPDGGATGWRPVNRPLLKDDHPTFRTGTRIHRVNTWQNF